jgi:hypothetical protein
MRAYLKVVMLGIVFGLLGGLLLGAVQPAHGRDAGQWENGDPAVREWYRSLMQPDNPTRLMLWRSGRLLVR